MLKGVITILENSSTDLFYSEFRQRLCSSGLALIHIPPIELSVSNSPSTVLSKALEASSLHSTDCLLITDSEVGSLAAKAIGCPCIGYLGSKENYSPFSNAYALLESFEGADVSYLCHTHAHALSYPEEIVSTEHLMIREFSASDFASLYPICTSPETAPFMEEVLSDYNTEYEKHMAYLSTVYPIFDLALWGVFEKETGALVGRAGYSLPDAEEDVFSLGYLIAPYYRRRGYATECVNAILSYAKEQGYSEVSVRIKKENHASRKVLEHCTFPSILLSKADADVLVYRILLSPHIA